MTTFTKLLPPEAAPAQALLERAKQLVITSEERMTWGDAFETAEGTIAVAIEEKRPLMVNDVFVDDAGQFWVVRPAVEKVLHVKGDLRTMQEAVGALINRGVEVAEAPEGFAVLPLPNIAKMLGMIGLEVTEVEEAFEPVRIQRHAGGCGCGCGCGDHHHDEGSCGCGCGCGDDHHHDEGSCGCGCGEHHHHHEDSCGCGCGCGDEHHHHHHHHHHEENCGCGCGEEHHHHHHEESSCGCGCKH